MENLSAADRTVAVIAKVLREHDRFFQDRRLTKQVAIDARFDWMNTGHHRYPRRVTGRSRTMGIGKGDRSLRQAIEVRRLHAGMIIQRRDVVVQIIDRDEEDVGLLAGCLT